MEREFVKSFHDSSHDTSHDTSSFASFKNLADSKTITCHVYEDFVDFS